MRVCTRSAAVAKSLSSNPVSWPCSAKKARSRAANSAGVSLRMLGVDGFGLLLVEAGRVGVDVDDVEGRHHLSRLKTSRSSMAIPQPSKEIVVRRPSGRKPLVDVQKQVGLRVTLPGQFPAFPIT